MEILDIKKLTVANIAQINALLKQLSEKAPVVSKKDLIRVMKNGAILDIRDADDNKKIIGIATLVVFGTLMGKTGRIEDVVVDKKYRGKGLGKRLVEGLIQKAREFHLKQIDLTSSPKRGEANALYQNLGFEKRETNVYRMVL